MPTGYTAIIEDNKNVTFNDYLFGCARAFGACIDMRDESQNKKIPKEFKISNYSKERSKEAKEALLKLNMLNEVEAESEAKKEYKKELNRLQKAKKKVSEQLIRYDNILKEVHEWAPPTKDHEELKKFMIDQIKISTDSDMEAYYIEELFRLKQLSGKAWVLKQVIKLQRSITYHTEEHEKEVERVTNRNKWIKNLRESIN